MSLSSWYFGSESIYFDIFYTDSKLQRFKIIIKPDLSDASLHITNMSEIMLDDLTEWSESYRVCEGYRICEDALVYFWNYRFESQILYTGLILTSADSAPFTNVVTQWNASGGIKSICPTSGRFVYSTNDNDGNLFRQIVVVDLF